MQAEQITMLVTSAGRRVELLECFRRSGADLGLSLEIIACDLVPHLSAACQIADVSYAVPRCTAPDYIDSLIDIVQRHDVQLVVPTIDPELEPLACAQERFTQLGARVCVSDPDAIRIARDKMMTMCHFKAAGIPVPRTIAFEEARAASYQLDFPLFMKPSGGSASRGLVKLEGADDLPLEVDEPMILQEFLEGPEYTVNMFIDAVGTLRAVVPHERLAIRAGEVEKGYTTRDEALRVIAENIARSLPEARGVLCFQVIRDQRRGDRVIEINCRFGGGFPLADQAGAKFAQWLLEEVSGRRCSAHDDWTEGVLMLRYDAAVFPS